MLFKSYLLFIFLLFQIKSYSQIYYSSIFDHVIIVGPENVTPKSEEVAIGYSAEIDGLLQELEKLIVSNNVQIKAFDSNNNKTEEETNKLKLLNEDSKSLVTELLVAEDLKEKWSQYIGQQDKLMELYLLLNKGECFKINSSIGELGPKDFFFKVDNSGEQILVRDSFDITITKGELGWIKKYAENGCLSPDPEDCVMYCYEELPPSINFIGYNDIPYRIQKEECPINYKLISDKNICVRYRSLNKKNNKAVLNLLSVKSKKSIQLESWKKVECN